MPSNLGPAEIVAILVVALIVLGPKRLPEAGRQVGRAIAEVRRWSQGFQSEIRSAIEAEPEPARAPSPPPLTASAEPSAPTNGSAEPGSDGSRPPDPPVDRPPG